MNHFSDGMTAPRWTDGLDAARLATVARKNRAMNISTAPPDPVAFQVAALDAAARATAERAWVNHANQWAESQREAMEPYAAQLRAQNAREQAEQKRTDDAKRRERDEADEEREARRTRQQAAILALSADASETIAAIRAEIAGILEA